MHTTETSQPTGIQLHLTNGHSRMFYQDDPGLVAKICEDMDGQMFARASLIIDSQDDTTAFPGQALVGISVLTDPLPDSFYERERLSKTFITQISEERFLFRRLQDLSKLEGQRSAVLSRIEFVSGQLLFLEFSEVAVSGMDERNVMQHLFLRPSIFCRRLDGGFSIWNTAHIVSWSHYPKLEVPSSAWSAESFQEAVPGDAKIVNLPYPASQPAYT